MDNLTLAEDYYTAVSKKDLPNLEKYIHPEVHFVTPLAEMKGKEAFLKALEGFISTFKTLKIRASFDSNDQALIVYDVDFPAPIGNVPSAALLNFQRGLIAKIELIYDARLLEETAQKIFS